MLIKFPEKRTRRKKKQWRSIFQEKQIQGQNVVCQFFLQCITAAKWREERRRDFLETCRKTCRRRTFPPPGPRTADPTDAAFNVHNVLPSLLIDFQYTQVIPRSFRTPCKDRLSLMRIYRDCAITWGLSRVKGS